MKVRIKFSKYGALRFIGHLDLMRTFQKALRRADIDVTYTTGFSPHQVMTFAAPLGMGLCSIGEYMDIEVDSHRGAADLKERLQAACPEGIDILSVRALPEPEPNKKVISAMASVSAAAYAAVFKDSTRSFSDWAGQSEAFLSQTEILSQKESKKGTVTVNLRPGIRDLHVEDGALVFTVDAGSRGNIRPEQVTECFFAFLGVRVPANALQLIRLELYADRGTPEKPDFVPLEALGEEF